MSRAAKHSLSQPADGRSLFTAHTLAKVAFSTYCSFPTLLHCEPHTMGSRAIELGPMSCLRVLSSSHHSDLSLGSKPPPYWSHSHLKGTNTDIFFASGLFWPFPNFSIPSHHFDLSFSCLPFWPIFVTKLWVQFQQILSWAQQAKCSWSTMY